MEIFSEHFLLISDINTYSIKDQKIIHKPLVIHFSSNSVAPDSETA